MAGARAAEGLAGAAVRGAAVGAGAAAGAVCGAAAGSGCGADSGAGFGLVDAWAALKTRAAGRAGASGDGVGSAAPERTAAGAGVEVGARAGAGAGLEVGSGWNPGGGTRRHLVSGRIPEVGWEGRRAETSVERGAEIAVAASVAAIGPGPGIALVAPRRTEACRKMAKAAPRPAEITASSPRSRCPPTPNGRGFPGRRES